MTLVHILEWLGTGNIQGLDKSQREKGEMSYNEGKTNIRIN